MMQGTGGQARTARTSTTPVSQTNSRTPSEFLAQDEPEATPQHGQQGGVVDVAIAKQTPPPPRAGLKRTTTWNDLSVLPAPSHAVGGIQRALNWTNMERISERSGQDGIEMVRFRHRGAQCQPSDYAERFLTDLP